MGEMKSIESEKESGKKKMANTIPKDPVMLLSYINTLLRDKYSSLELLGEEMELNVQELKEKLSVIDYTYDAERNQFV